jgi:hypothetical protein
MNVSLSLIDKLSQYLFNSDNYFFSSQLCDYMRMLGSSEEIENLHLNLYSFELLTQCSIQS